MEKVPACWERMSIVWDELNSRKAEKSNIAAIWVDIATVYGSVPHELLFFCPEAISHSRTVGVFVY